MASHIPSINDRPFRIEKEDRFENMLSEAVRQDKLTLEDTVLIREYIDEKCAETNISYQRIQVLYNQLITWRRFIGSYRENKINDIYSGISKFENGNIERKIVCPDRKKSQKFIGGKYSTNTRRDYIFSLRQFYKWLVIRGEADPSVTLEKIDRIKKPRQKKMTKTAEQLLTEGEIKKMIEACFNSRDRAIISMLYEGGFRIKEIGRLTWNQVKIDQYGIVVNVDEKTGKPRYVRLIMSLQYLATWKNDYPFSIKEDSPVFITKQYKPMTYSVLYQIIQELGKRAGISKRITPHLFRHSRITHLIQQGYQESVIKKMMWGNIGTDMFNTYAHLTDADIENEVLEKAGIKASKMKKERILEPRQCQKCMNINAPTANYCTICGLPLTEDAQMIVQNTGDKVREILMQNPQAQTVFLEILKELQMQSV